MQLACFAIAAEEDRRIFGLKWTRSYVRFKPLIHAETSSIFVVVPRRTHVQSPSRRGFLMNSNNLLKMTRKFQSAILYPMKSNEAPVNEARITGGKSFSFFEISIRK